MKALLHRLFQLENGRKPPIGALVFCTMLILVLGISSFATQVEAGKFLIAVATGIVISIALRMALNFDPEE